jgi:hypothetical protein
MRCDIPSDYESSCAAHAIEGVQTCQGLAVNTVKTEDAAREEVAGLSTPLSAWEGSSTVRNMAERVQRPNYIREQEIKPDGYIPRPLNSFFLYRGAYLQRANEWCNHNMPPGKQNKQQILSRVIAQSWKMEDSNTCKFYQELAVTERINHESAHKSYKFAPRRSDPKRRASERTAPRIKGRSRITGEGSGSSGNGITSQGYPGSMSHDPLIVSHPVFMQEVPAVQPARYCSHLLGPTSRVLSTTFAPGTCTMRDTSLYHDVNSATYQSTWNSGDWTYATPPGGVYDYSFPLYYPDYFTTAWSGDGSLSLRI